MQFNHSHSRPNVVLVTSLEICTIPNAACEAYVSFVKETTGDTIYIKFGGDEPSATNWDVKLTDSRSVFNEFLCIKGPVKAVGSAVTSQLSTFIPYKTL